VKVKLVFDHVGKVGVNSAQLLEGLKKKFKKIKLVIHHVDIKWVLTARRFLRAFFQQKKKEAKLERERERRERERGSCPCPTTRPWQQSTGERERERERERVPCQRP
jgi:hypothetical protein